MGILFIVSGLDQRHEDPELGRSPPHLEFFFEPSQVRKNKGVTSRSSRAPTAVHDDDHALH